MPTWINRTAGTAGRNGTTTHSVSFTAAGANSLLVVLVGGGVTTTFSTGWTKQLSALGGTEMCVATRIATAGDSTVTLTHNAANYPVQWVVYEFPAGSTFSVGTSSPGNGLTDPWQALTGIPSGATVFAALCAAIGDGPTSASTTWTTPATEDLDAFTVFSTTSAAYVSDAYADNVTGGSLTPASSTSLSTGGATSSERVVFAVVPTVSGNQSPTANAGPDQTVQATYTSAGVAGPTVTLTGAASSDPDGTIASYAWTQTSGTAVTLSGTGATRTFTAPRFGGTLVFGLTVTDNGGASSSQDTVQVAVTGVAYGYVRVAGAWVKRPIFVRRSGAWDSTPSIPAGSYTTTYGATY